MRSNKTKNKTGHLFSEAELNQLYQYAMVLCQHQQDAFDLLQSALETYLKKHQQGFVPEQGLAYLRKVIKNKYIDSYRSKARFRSEPYEESAVYDISPIDLEKMHIDQSELQQVWKTLSEQDREMLYYWGVLGLSTDEVCQHLEMPRGTFLSRVYRIRQRSKNTINDTSGNGV